MSSSILKCAAVLLILATVFAQVPQNDGLGNYQQQTCCPKGYNVANGIYCVKCNSPKHWDALSQRCVTCEPGHTWDNVTHECSCCESPRKIIGADCVCPAPKTVWSETAKTCSCPANSFGDNCIPCPPPRQWNYQNNTCFCPPPTTEWNGYNCTCPAGRYGPSCVECPSPRHWDSQTNQCVCNAPFIWNGQDCVCPPPYFLYQGRCANCPDGYKWEDKENRCKKCECSFKELSILTPNAWNDNLSCGLFLNSIKIKTLELNLNLNLKNVQTVNNNFLIHEFYYFF